MWHGAHRNTTACLWDEAHIAAVHLHVEDERARIVVGVRHDRPKLLQVQRGLRVWWAGRQRAWPKRNGQAAAFQRIGTCDLIAVGLDGDSTIGSELDCVA